MFDFGSILGSGTVYAQRHRAGQRIHLRAEAGLAHAGDARPVRAAVDAHRLSRTCRSRSAASRPTRSIPLKWKPEYPNPAFDNMRPDDAFWAARIVSQLHRRDDSARSSQKAQYSDPRATDYMTKTLITRRDKVVADVAQPGLPRRRPGARRRRRAHVRQRRGRRHARPTPAGELSAAVVPLRQRGVDADAGRQPRDRDRSLRPRAGGTCGVGRLRRRRDQRDASAAARVGKAVDVLLPPRRRGMDSGGGGEGLTAVARRSTFYVP